MESNTINEAGASQEEQVRARSRTRRPLFHLKSFLQHVDPWTVSGGADGKIDYDKLIQQASHGAAT